MTNEETIINPLHLSPRGRFVADAHVVSVNLAGQTYRLLRPGRWGLRRIERALASAEQQGNTPRQWATVIGIYDRLLPPGHSQDLAVRLLRDETSGGPLSLSLLRGALHSTLGYWAVTPRRPPRRPANQDPRFRGGSPPRSRPKA